MVGWVMEVEGEVEVWKAEASLPKVGRKERPEKGRGKSSLRVPSSPETALQKGKSQLTCLKSNFQLFACAGAGAGLMRDDT